MAQNWERRLKPAATGDPKDPGSRIDEELIYNTMNLRDRLILELQARCGLRIGGSLKIEASDVTDLDLERTQIWEGVRGSLYAGADSNSA